MTCCLLVEQHKIILSNYNFLGQKFNLKTQVVRGPKVFLEGIANYEKYLTSYIFIVFNSFCEDSVWKMFFDSKKPITNLAHHWQHTSREQT